MRRRCVTGNGLQLLSSNAWSLSYQLSSSTDKSIAPEVVRRPNLWPVLHTHFSSGLSLVACT